MDEGFTLWFTGLPSAGKSTLAEATQARLRAAGRRCELLDGDVIRTNLSAGLGFSKADRDINIRRVGFVCDLLSRNGIIALAACVSPYRSTRDEVRALMPDRFVEVHVNTSLATCTARDVKGLYAKTDRGEMSGMTGLDDPYEPPLHPEIRVDTEGQTVEASVAFILQRLEALGRPVPAAR